MATLQRDAGWMRAGSGAAESWPSRLHLPSWLLKAWMALWAAMGVVAGALAYAFACAVALEFSVGGVLIALAAGAFAGAYASRTRAVRMMALRAGISVGRRAVRRNGHTPALQAGGADLVVSDLAELLRDP